MDQLLSNFLCPKLATLESTNELCREMQERQQELLLHSATASRFKFQKFKVFSSISLLGNSQRSVQCQVCLMTRNAITIQIPLILCATSVACLHCITKENRDIIHLTENQLGGWPKLEIRALLKLGTRLNNVMQ